MLENQCFCRIMNIFKPRFNKVYTYNRMIRLQKLIPVAVACAMFAPAVAQKKKYTIEDATLGIYTSLRPEGISKASWEPNTNKLYQVVKGDEKEQYWVSMAFPSKHVDTVLSLSMLNDVSDEKLRSMPTMHWLDKGLVYYQKGNKLVKGLLTGGGYQWMDWATLPDDAEHVTVDDSKNIAYTVDNNLWMIDKSGKKIQVTNDNNKHVLNGQSVHRSEFGISGGIFFSPQGNYLAYYHMDESMVNDYPVIDWSAGPASVKNIKYPMAGGTSHEVKLKVYNPRTGKTTEVKTEGPKDQYLTCITWSPDEMFIYIAVLNRDQNHMMLNKYDAETGNKVATLFEERDDKYVEPQHEMAFLPGSNDRFIWWSQRDGYMHLYLYNTNGKLIKQLTRGEWNVTDIVGMNKAEEQLIIAGTRESALESHTYALDWNTGRMNQIDKGVGTHNAMASENGNYILDVYTANDIPKRTAVLGVNSKFSYVVKEAADPLADYDRPEIKSVTLYANDGTALFGKLILPTNFDKSKKYPVIVYLYNGPHVQLVRNRFPESGNLWYEYMAQRGYVVFTMDGRGSSNRGMKFEQATFGKLGTVEMEDQLQGVKYLKSLPFVDANRMGVHGWSFGGFMTTSLMLRHPGTFQVGVAGGPVIDWSMYEVMYTERYMNTPQTNAKGYEDNNLLTKVDNLEGDLLIIHGAQDDVVVWQHSMKLIRESVKKGKQIDYFVYPAHPHNVRGKDRVHLMQKITDYFDAHLKP